MSPADEDLHRAALDLIAAAQRGRSVVAALKARCPEVYQQVRRDAKFPGLLALWGRCMNFDENAKQTVVHPAILRALGELAGIPVRGRVVHAGLQHTYGYLFSVIETPYGFKRDRWVSDDLERGLGVERSLLGERPAHGTLLANATWLLGKIAFRGRSRNLAALESQSAAVAPELVAYDFDALTVDRIEERAARPGAVRRDVTIVTDLVTPPHAPKGDRLLIYSTAAGCGPLRLVTAFPVRPDVAAGLVARGRAGGAAEVQLKYNAYVRGFYGKRGRGRVAVA